MDAPGSIVAGKYELVRAHAGGMAVVWKARTIGEGARRVLAVKRIGLARSADPHFVQLFEEEARIGASLRHANLVEVFDFGVDERGAHYLAMEWVEGLDMFQWLRAFPSRRSPPPWPLVASIGCALCRGLAAAHGRRDGRGHPAAVFHRDVSPSNVLLSTTGIVKLTDFGLARAVDRASITRPNVIKGKLAYSAPELTNGAPPSARTDVFSLGVVLWEALAQRRLFTGVTDLDLLLAVRRGDVPRLDGLRRDVPRGLARVVHAALAMDPGERPVDASAMGRALASVLREHGVEPGSAMALGRSVRAARDRLDRPTSREARSPIPPGTVSLSLRDLEPLDAGLAPPRPSPSPPSEAPWPLVRRRSRRGG